MFLFSKDMRKRGKQHAEVNDKNHPHRSVGFRYPSVRPLGAERLKTRRGTTMRVTRVKAGKKKKGQGGNPAFFFTFSLKENMLLITITSP